MTTHSIPNNQPLSVDQMKVAVQKAETKAGQVVMGGVVTGMLSTIGLFVGMDMPTSVTSAGVVASSIVGLVTGTLMARRGTKDLLGSKELEALGSALAEDAPNDNPTPARVRAQDRFQDGLASVRRVSVVGGFLGPYLFGSNHADGDMLGMVLGATLIGLSAQSICSSVMTRKGVDKSLVRLENTMKPKKF